MLARDFLCLLQPGNHEAVGYERWWLERVLLLRYSNMHGMITPKYVVTNWDYIMEHAGGSQRENNEYQHRDDQFVVFFD